MVVPLDGSSPAQAALAPAKAALATWNRPAAPATHFDGAPPAPIVVPRIGESPIPARQGGATVEVSGRISATGRQACSPSPEGRATSLEGTMKILVALDTSDKDDAVLAQASRLARTTGAELTLVHVLNPFVDPSDATAPFLPERLAQVKQWRERYVHARARDLAGLPVQVRVEWQRRPPGHRCEDVADCLARVARDLDTDLLVLASKRASGVAGLLLGSTAQAMLRLSPCPVLVVRPPDHAVPRASDHAVPRAHERAVAA
jgi:universal stress protein A